MINKSWILLASLSCIAFLVGCTAEAPVGTVKGTASLKGKPYSDAAVMFISLEKGVGSGGDLKPDGTFTLTEPLPIGQYTVYFAPKSVSVEDSSAAPVPMHLDKSVPSKYWSESSSDIKVEVKTGENVVPIEVK